MWWPEALDEAIRDRPGRFDRRIEIPAPPAGACEELLRSRLGEYAEEEDVRWLSKKAAGATGAALEELANTVLLMGLEAAAEGTDAEGPEPALRLTRSILETAWERFQFAARPASVGFGSGRE